MEVAGFLQLNQALVGFKPPNNDDAVNLVLAKLCGNFGEVFFGGLLPVRAEVGSAKGTPPIHLLPRHLFHIGPQQPFEPFVDAKHSVALVQHQPNKRPDGTVGARCRCAHVHDGKAILWAALVLEVRAVRLELAHQLPVALKALPSQLQCLVKLALLHGPVDCLGLLHTPHQRHLDDPVPLHCH